MNGSKRCSKEKSPPVFPAGINQYLKNYCIVLLDVVKVCTVANERVCSVSIYYEPARIYGQRKCRDIRNCNINYSACRSIGNCRIMVGGEVRQIIVEILSVANNNISICRC